MGSDLINKLRRKRFGSYVCSQKKILARLEERLNLLSNINDIPLYEWRYDEATDAVM